MRKVLFSILPSIFYLLFVSSVSAQEAPRLEILLPVDGVSHAIDEEITVRIAVENFVFVDVGGNREPFAGAGVNAGHAHLWVLNRGQTPGTGSDPGERGSRTKLSHDSARKLVSDDPVRLGTLPRGTYAVIVELTQNHHESFSPPVVAATKFRVGTGAFGVLGAGDFDTTSLVMLAVVLLVIGVVWMLIDVVPSVNNRGQTPGTGSDPA